MRVGWISRTSRDSSGWTLGAILASALLLRLYRVNAPAEDFLSWRETVTLMVARNFYRFGMNPFVPRVDWSLQTEAAAVNILGGSEFMVTPYLTAALYHLFGIQNWVSRVVPIAFSLFGLWAFHRFIENLYDRRTAHAGTILLMVSPYYLYCGRTQQPESFAHAMAIAALYAFYCWVERRGLGRFLAAALAAIAMMLGKPTMGVIAIPMAYILWRQGGFRAWLQPSTLAFAVAVGIPVSGYMYWSFGALDASTSVTLGGEGWYFAHMKWLLDPGYYAHIGGSLFFWSLTPVVALAVLIGLVLAVRKPEHRVGSAWFVGVMSMFALIPGGAETNGYYQLIVAPPACLLASAAIADGFRSRRVAWVGPVLILAAILNSFYVAARLFAPEYASHVACGRWIDANTDKHAKVLNAFQSTTLLYYADRRGWNCWLKSAGPHPQFDTAAIESAVDNGANLVAVPYPQFDDSSYPDFDGVRDYLYRTYDCYKTPEFTVFRLDRPADLTLPAGRRIVFGNTAARKFLRGPVGRDYTLADGVGFVPIGPSNPATIEFRSHERLASVALELASTVPNHSVSVRVNGGTVHRLLCDAANERMRFALSAIPPSIDGNLHRIEITTTQKVAQGVGLVLFELAAPAAE